jgi:hypothetical protein
VSLRSDDPERRSARERRESWRRRHRILDWLAHTFAGGGEYDYRMMFALIGFVALCVMWLSGAR